MATKWRRNAWLWTAFCLPPLFASQPVIPVDADGVARLFPSAPGVSFHLGASDPNDAGAFVIEKGTPARANREGNWRFWNLPSHPLAYASGGEGWTSRLHIQARGGQRYTWKDRQGFLSSPDDIRNMEFTAYVRVHGILDPRRAAISLKVRGGRHTATRPDLASCAMLTFGPERRGVVSRFGKELTHPLYDYVPLTTLFPLALEENAWYGLKLVCWDEIGSPARTIFRLYVDAGPVETTTGRPANHWRLLSEFVDEEGKSTGRYATRVGWGGWQTTLRTDGFHDIDFALISLREIMPP